MVGIQVVNHCICIELVTCGKHRNFEICISFDQAFLVTRAEIEGTVGVDNIIFYEDRNCESDVLLLRTQSC